MTAERKPRKSVAFSDDTTIVDSNGGVTETNGTSNKTSAESHSAGTFAASQEALGIIAIPSRCLCDLQLQTLIKIIRTIYGSR